MRHKTFVAIVIIVFIGVIAPSKAAENISLILVSRGTDGLAANENSQTSAHVISSNGRFVAFISTASNLIPGGTNGQRHVFVFDKETSSINLASVSSDGIQGNGGVRGGGLCALSISSDGRFVSFPSSSTNLVPNDTNDSLDIFVRDLQTNTTTRVSISSDGVEGTNDSFHAFISANGRYVVFESNTAFDGVIPGSGISVYIHDRETSTTKHLPVAGAFCPVISSDGRYVAFLKVSGVADNVFVYDRIEDTLTCLSQRYDGNKATADSYPPSISEDGRFIVFASDEGKITDIPNDSDTDIYLYDQIAGEMLFLDTDYSSGNPMISPNGNYLVFISSNVGIDDRAFFVYNIEEKNFEIITLNQRDTGKSLPSISNNGAFISFQTGSDGLVPEDNNGFLDVFLLDRRNQIYTNHIYLPVVVQ